MQEAADIVDPFAGSETLADLEKVRVRRVRVPRENSAVWHRKLGSVTLVFAESEGVTVQIRKPPYCNTLSRGEHYSVPAGVDMAIYAAGEESVHCIVFEFGESLTAVRAPTPSLGYVIHRSREVVSDSAVMHGTRRAYDYDKLRGGFSRMDVLTFHDDVRLLLQGNGHGECVPWHSHDLVTDTFFCTRGTVRIATRDPHQEFVLEPGDTCQVESGVAHFVSGLHGAACEVLILQWGGHYNYVQR
jgi:quercetin dioxygenase-like cupin family protein